MNKFSYAVCVPPYDPKSNGVTALYQLYELILETGRDARLCLIPNNTNNHSNTPYKFRTQYTSHMAGDNEITIYPDVVSNNPFFAKHVVRYLLNRPWFLTQSPILYDRTDYLLAYSNYIDETLPTLFLLDNKLKGISKTFSTPKEKLIAIYLGKFNLKTECIQSLKRALTSKGFKFSIITRSFPTNKNDYYYLLAKASGLISLDPLSNVVLESLVFNTPVYLPYDTYATQHTKIDIEVNGLTFRECDFVEAVTHRFNLGVAEQVDLSISSAMPRLNDALSKIEAHFQVLSGSDTDARDRILTKNQQIIYDQFEKDKQRYLEFIGNEPKPNLVQRIIRKGTCLIKSVHSI